jgi:iron complex outermembrane recepter protein
MKPIFRMSAIALAASATVSGLVCAQASAAPGLADLSLEEILNVKVTSVSRKTERLHDTAAAVYVISAEDIRRSGATNIPEALRMAPGVDVGRISTGQYAVSARGLNGRFANKLLVLMDGRSIYSPLFSGVLWENEDTLIEDIERIEVIRGPNAALWGSNAVNGVINIITKSARDTQGGLAVASVGTSDKGALSLRYGGVLGNDAHWRVYAKGFERGPTEEAGGVTANDRHTAKRLGFRVDGRGADGGSYTVLGDAHETRMRDTWLLPSVLPPFVSRTPFLQDSSGFNLLARREFRLGGGSSISLQGWYAHSHLNAQSLVEEKRDTGDIDIQHRFKAGAHEVIWGANYRHSSDATTGSSFVNLQPANRRLSWASLFAHDEWTLVPERLRLMVGARLERDSYSGTSFQPNARLAWTPNTETTFWGALSRAARTPSRGDHDTFILQQVVPPGTAQNPGPLAILTRGVPGGVDAETVDAVELGWRANWGKRFSTNLSLYRNRYRDLRGVGQAPPQLILGSPPYVLADLPIINFIDGTIYGGELAADWRATNALRFRLGYSAARPKFRNALGGEDFITQLTAGASPRHSLSLQTSIDVTERQQLDIWLRRTGALSFGAIPAYTTLDIRYGWRITRNFELSLVGQNLLDSRHPEFLQDNIPAPQRELKRAGYLQAEIKF